MGFPKGAKHPLWPRRWYKATAAEWCEWTRAKRMVTSAFTAVVKAWDTDTNENSRTYYIRYDINGPKEIIFIKYPPQNPYTTNQSTYNIVATIFNPEGESVIVTITHIESGTSAALDTLNGGAEQDASYSASLLLGSNTLIISVHDTGSTVIAKDTVGITYTTGNIVDVIPPYISSITVNGEEGKSHFIAGDYAYLELEAIDENMDSVVINNVLKSPVNQYVWKDTLALTGAPQYFIIHLTDSSGNTTDDTAMVRKNSLPVISSTVSWPKTLIIGRQWSTTFTVNDDDGDSIFIDHVAHIGSSIPQHGVQLFSLDMWIDGFAGAQNSVSIQSGNIVADINYTILGGGSKHAAVKNWDGDMVEIVEFQKCPEDDERRDMFMYLASKYKITLHSND